MRGVANDKHLVQAASPAKPLTRTPHPSTLSKHPATLFAAGAPVHPSSPAAPRQQPRPTMTTGATILPSVRTRVLYRKHWCRMLYFLRVHHYSHPAQAGPVTQQDMEQLVMRLYEIEVCMKSSHA